MRFEWDQRKAKDNLRKHGISFEVRSKSNEIRVETLWMRLAMCDEKFDMTNCVMVDAPWTREIGREVLLKLSHRVIDYFGRIGDRLDLPPEHVMEIYLRHIAETGIHIPIQVPAADDETETAAVGDSL